LTTDRVYRVQVPFDVLAVLAEPGRPVTVQHYPGAF
jgi:hypothetical protein